MNNDILINNIKTLCANDNISIGDLEKVLSFGGGLIGKWSKSVPSIDKVDLIADYFNVTIDYLVGRDDTYLSQNSKADKFISDLINKTKQNIVVWESSYSDTDIHEKLEESTRALYPYPNDDVIVNIIAYYIDVENGYVYIVRNEFDGFHSLFINDKKDNKLLLVSDKTDILKRLIDLAHYKYCKEEDQLRKESFMDVVMESTSGYTVHKNRSNLTDKNPLKIKIRNAKIL